MAHLPVNHPLRPVYRATSALIGLYVLGFGAVGLWETSGSPAFNQGSTTALGLRTNLAFSLASVVVGALILLASAVGRNVDRMVNILIGVLFLVTGIGMLALLRTNANVFNFSIATCNVSFVIGMLLLAAGLYGKVGRVKAADAGKPLEHAGR